MIQKRQSWEQQAAENRCFCMCLVLHCAQMSQIPGDFNQTGQNIESKYKKITLVKRQLCLGRILRRGSLQQSRQIRRLLYAHLSSNHNNQKPSKVTMQDWRLKKIEEMQTNKICGQSQFLSSPTQLGKPLSSSYRTFLAERSFEKNTQSQNQNQTEEEAWLLEQSQPEQEDDSQIDGRVNDEVVRPPVFRRRQKNILKGLAKKVLEIFEQKAIRTSRQIVNILLKKSLGKKSEETEIQKKKDQNVLVRVNEIISVLIGVGILERDGHIILKKQRKDHNTKELKATLLAKQKILGEKRKKRNQLVEKAKQFEKNRKEFESLKANIKERIKQKYF